MIAQFWETPLTVGDLLLFGLIVLIGVQLYYWFWRKYEARQQRNESERWKQYREERERKFRK